MRWGLNSIPGSFGVAQVVVVGMYHGDFKNGMTPMCSKMSLIVDGTGLFSCCTQQQLMA